MSTARHRILRLWEVNTHGSPYACALSQLQHRFIKVCSTWAKPEASHVVVQPAKAKSGSEKFGPDFEFWLPASMFTHSQLSQQPQTKHQSH